MYLEKRTESGHTFLLQNIQHCVWGNSLDVNKIQYTSCFYYVLVAYNLQVSSFHVYFQTVTQLVEVVAINCFKRLGW